MGRLIYTTICSLDGYVDDADGVFEFQNVPRSYDVHVAGSVFLGAWSPEAVGDYCSGTNHVLPTYGFARAWSGVSVASFQKQVSVQELSPCGLREIGPDAMTLAHAEGLHAHERAVSLRLAALAGEGA